MTKGLNLMFRIIVQGSLFVLRIITRIDEINDPGRQFTCMQAAAEALSSFIWRFRAASLLSREEVEEIFPRYEQVCAVYPRLDSDMVSCHSGLKPENIRFDGQRVWLVGWQAAFVNDRYFDLAVAANFLVTNRADERTYLERYFGQPPDEYQHA